MKYLIANWKANKNLEEATAWVDVIVTKTVPTETLKIIICPPFPLIVPLMTKLNNRTDIALGSQDVSQFESGKHTGEVSAQSLRSLVKYTIVGHSERRQEFNETDETIGQKIIQAQKNRIEPILCIRNEADLVPQGIKMLVYEPVHSIGTGDNEDAAKVVELKGKLKLDPSTIFLYGGSVNKNDIDSYLSTSQIDGFLVGTASLDPNEFLSLIQKIL